MISATRRLQFCAGHRVHQHESKCRNLHGHNYVVFLKAVGTTSSLDELGRVIDFGSLKQRFGTWIDEHWDHNMILWEGDSEALAAVKSIGGQKLFLLPKNPTAENMACYLLEEVGPRVLDGTGIRIVEVTLWETENCYATVVSDVR
jgi:6-pyruvoyltetrahydropterin/6-carboxytetrahydropterin synthase